MAATHVIRCSPGCVPSPEVFSKIYGVVKRGDEEKYTELFKTIPDDALKSNTKEKGPIAIVIVLFFCLIMSVVFAGTVYYFQEEVAKLLDYKDADTMLKDFGLK